MNDKLKKIIIPFVLMLVFNLGIYYLKGGQNFGGGLSVHVGILLVSGMILGPYGALGATVANFLCDMIRGYGPVTAAGSFFSDLQYHILVINYGMDHIVFDRMQQDLD